MEPVTSWAHIVSPSSPHPPIPRERSHGARGDRGDRGDRGAYDVRANLWKWNPGLADRRNPLAELAGSRPLLERSPPTINGGHP